MKVKSVELKPLASKHYQTEIVVYVEDESGNEWNVGVCVYGYSPKPSQREIDTGWEEEFGMDHVETEVAYKVAVAIVEALKGGTL